MSKFFFLFFIVLFFIKLLQAFPFSQKGYASWYGGKFHGRKTANGEIYDMDQLTAAHRFLPFGTIVKVYNLQNGKTVTVRINDRGPFVKDRIIDLSKKAAKMLGMEYDGTANVYISSDSPNITEEVINNEKRSFYTIQVAAYKNPLNAKRMKEKVSKQASLDPVAVLTKEGIIRIEVRSVHKDNLKRSLSKLEEIGIFSTIVRQQS